MASRSNRWNPSSRTASQHPAAHTSPPQTSRNYLMSHQLSRRSLSSHSASGPSAQDRPSTASTQQLPESEEDAFETEEEEIEDDEDDDHVSEMLQASLFNQGQTDPIDAAMEMLRAEEAAEGENGDPTSSGDVRRDIRDTGEDKVDLIERYRSHSRSAVDAVELKVAILDSLRNKVNSLDKDKWIYEPDMEIESPL